MAGAMLVAAASPAQALITYQNEDLLLSFRNAINTSGSNVTVDLGQISTFSNLTCTTVLNNGVNNGYTPLFTENELMNSFGGSLNDVGFTAIAVDNVSETVWLTRTQPTVSAGPDYPPSQLGDISIVTSRVGQIGLGIGGFDGTSASVSSLDPSGKIVSVPSSDAYSYQSVASASDEPYLINFGGELTGEYVGGYLENVSTAGNTVYSALWMVPVKSAGAPTYLGYFTFNGATGEVDYTAGPPVPLLSIAQSGASVVISWPNTGSFTLQQNTDETASGSWTTCSAPVTLAGGTDSVTIALPPTGNLYFRLAVICP